MENKQIIPVMLLEDGRAGEWHIEDPIEAALYMDKCHADGVLIRDMTTKDHHQEEKLIKLVKNISGQADIPLYVNAAYTRFENVKKIIYAGAAKAVITYKKEEDIYVIKEAADRFHDQVAVYLEDQIAESLELSEYWQSLVSVTYLLKEMSLKISVRRWIFMTLM